MKHIKFFEHHTEYEEAEPNLVRPNVSYCEDVRDVHYNPYVHDYSQDYFTTVALEDGTISFNIWKDMDTDMITSISYSTDNGKNWTTTNNSDGKQEHLTITASANQGDKILWKGDAQQLGFYDEGGAGDAEGSFFSSDCEFNAEGNVMSLLYGDNFQGETSLTGNGYNFVRLFSDDNKTNECKIVSAENLSLPATALTLCCYQYMFLGCSGLTAAPSVLPATTLAYACYNQMFANCTSLTTAPELSATTLAESCYESMFNGCTSLTTAPQLPSTTLADACYAGMFSDCENLNSITCLATDISADDCTLNWLDGVADNGTFTKAASMNNWSCGGSAIPCGWTIMNDDGTNEGICPCP